MITDLLHRWKTGDREVEQALMDLAYPTLVELAHAQARRNGGVLTLQATELAHEAYARLIQQRSVDWKSREHFYAIAATVIRRVVVDYLRLRHRDKRGGKLPFVSLDEIDERDAPGIDESVDWISVDQALNEFAEFDPVGARLVELKFFSGLNTEQIAEVMGSSVATVGRQWRLARAWLGQRLGVDDSEP
ncbi:MAG: ECF-type sigma factor [Lysobacterales bacterium]|nr:sigma-70 family RNA polymerase sigma factor [Xanthomonadales bacterium]MCB1613706.1 sigma-70 family RNA polymerase sigma factor [Xanthomonadales bacterium]MCP5476445.1 sigma-70 family RNA polymerase sigma factor [Rhodanobacteraceae bacterium]